MDFISFLLVKVDLLNLLICYHSARQQPDVVDQKLAKELEAHRLVGSFDTPPFPVFRVSPLGIVPQKTPGEFRLIHHLSYPMGKLVIDGLSHA